MFLSTSNLIYKSYGGRTYALKSNNTHRMEHLSPRVEDGFAVSRRSFIAALGAGAVGQYLDSVRDDAVDEVVLHLYQTDTLSSFSSDYGKNPYHPSYVIQNYTESVFGELFEQTQAPFNLRIDVIEQPVSDMSKDSVPSLYDDWQEHVAGREDAAMHGNLLVSETVDDIFRYGHAEYGDSDGDPDLHTCAPSCLSSEQTDTAVVARAEHLVKLPQQEDRFMFPAIGEELEDDLYREALNVAFTGVHEIGHLLRFRDGMGEVVPGPAYATHLEDDSYVSTLMMGPYAIIEFAGQENVFGDPVPNTDEYDTLYYTFELGESAKRYFEQYVQTIA